MAETRDLVPELLIAIRDEMRGMREELHTGLADVRTELHTGLGEVRDEIRVTNERLDRVERRQVDAEMRFGTAIAELQGATRELITETRKLGDRIDHVLTGTMGRTLNDVVVRVERLEAKVG